jgi:hypothetical protein
MVPPTGSFILERSDVPPPYAAALSPVQVELLLFHAQAAQADPAPPSGSHGRRSRWKRCMGSVAICTIPCWPCYRRLARGSTSARSAVSFAARTRQDGRWAVAGRQRRRLVRRTVPVSGRDGDRMIRAARGRRCPTLVDPPETSGARGAEQRLIVAARQLMGCRGRTIPSGSLLLRR